MVPDRQVVGATNTADPSLNHPYDPHLGGARDTVVDIGGDRFFFAGAGPKRTFFGPFGKLGLTRAPDGADGHVEPGNGDAPLYDHADVGAWRAQPAMPARPANAAR